MHSNSLPVSLTLQEIAELSSGTVPDQLRKKFLEIYGRKIQKVFEDKPSNDPHVYRFIEKILNGEAKVCSYYATADHSGKCLTTIEVISDEY